MLICSCSCNSQHLSSFYSYGICASTIHRHHCHCINRKVLCLKPNFFYSLTLYALLANAFQLQLASLYCFCLFCSQLGLAGVVYGYDLYFIGGLSHFLNRCAGEGYVYIAALGPAVAEFLSIIKKIDVVC